MKDRDGIQQIFAEDKNLANSLDTRKKFIIFIITKL